MKRSEQKAESSIQLPNIDSIDLSILKLLQENARITVKEISEKVHLSTTPVHERIKRLEQNGVIKQYATLLNYAAVKKSLMAICYVSLRQHSKTAGAKFITAINSMEEVIECYTISGEFDFMLKVVTADMNAYYDFHVNKLGQLENLGHQQSVFVMGIVKETHQLIY